MFRNRSFNLVIGSVIAVLAVLSIATAAFAQQGEPVKDRNTPAYLALKERQLSQWDALATRVGTGTLVAEARTPVQAPPLEQVEAKNVTDPVGSVSFPNGDPYAGITDQQWERLEAMLAKSQAISTGRARYMDFKDAQLGQ